MILAVLSQLSHRSLLCSTHCEQALSACEEAGALLSSVVDGTTGVTDENEEVARIVRKSTKPVPWLANKSITLQLSRTVLGLTHLARRASAFVCPSWSRYCDLLDDIVNAPWRLMKKPEDDASLTFISLMSNSKQVFAKPTGQQEVLHCF